VSEIAIIPMEEGHFGVQITEGRTITSHRVVVPEAFVDDLALHDVDPADIVRQALEFLLEKEPATSIRGDFSVAEIPSHFNDFYEELRLRLQRLTGTRRPT